MLLLLIAAAGLLLPSLLTPEPPPPPRLPPAPPRSMEPTPEAARERTEGPPQSGLPDTTIAPPTAELLAASEEDVPIVERRHAQEGVGRIVEPAPRTPMDEPAEDVPRPPEEWTRSPAEREKRVREYGGNRLTEAGVEAGLAWLAAHQMEDGTWDRFNFDRMCPGHDRCTGSAVRRTEDDLQAGVSALALLAFLGGGYTDHEGPYQDKVGRGIGALLEMQQADGGFSRRPGMDGYNNALATLALAEYYAMTRAARVREPLTHAVERLVASQQALGGWDYQSYGSTGRNDTSITAWMVQALHAAAAVGIDVPPETMVQAAMHFTRATERDGRVRYADAGAGFDLKENLRPEYRYGAGMLAAGLVCEQMLGWRLDGSLARMQAARALADLPSEAKARAKEASKTHNEYYWYYGTLAMFQRGGDDWNRWNARLRDTLLPLQNRDKLPDGSKSHAYGSWPPYGANWGLFGRMGSRIYTTAICTLTLEVYYRHTPAFLREQLLFDAADWLDFVTHQRPVDQRVAVECLGQLRIEVGEPALVALLERGRRAVKLAAAAALARLDSPMGLPLLDETVSTRPPWQRRELEDALERARALDALPAVEGAVRLYDAERRLATVELPRSYVGMRLDVYRNGGRVGQMRVVQRFTGREVAVAVRVDAGEEVLAHGDRVVGQ